jgi:ATP-dependent Clp protease ATP-binding subunit ClpB
MTSNIGSQKIMEMAESNDQESIRSTVEEALRREFLPEFLNRVDEIIVFHPLGRREIRDIVDLQIDRLIWQMDEAGYQLSVSENARQLVATEGYDPTYGARPLKRVIQQRLQNALANEILSDRFAEGDSIDIDATADGFVFTGTVN